MTVISKSQWTNSIVFPVCVLTSAACVKELRLLPTMMYILIPKNLPGKFGNLFSKSLSIYFGKSPVIFLQKSGNLFFYGKWQRCGYFLGEFNHTVSFRVVVHARRKPSSSAGTHWSSDWLPRPRRSCGMVATMPDSGQRRTASDHVAASISAAVCHCIILHAHNNNLKKIMIHKAIWLCAVDDRALSSMAQSHMRELTVPSTS